jgi:hypothetical protein
VARSLLVLKPKRPTNYMTPQITKILITSATLAPLSKLANNFWHLLSLRWWSETLAAEGIVWFLNWVWVRDERTHLPPSLAFAYSACTRISIAWSITWKLGLQFFNSDYFQNFDIFLTWVFSIFISIVWLNKYVFWWYGRIVIGEGISFGLQEQS